MRRHAIAARATAGVRPTPRSRARRLEVVGVGHQSPERRRTSACGLPSSTSMACFESLERLAAHPMQKREADPDSRLKLDVPLRSARNAVPPMRPTCSMISSAVTALVRARLHRRDRSAVAELPQSADAHLERSRLRRPRHRMSTRSFGESVFRVRPSRRLQKRCVRDPKDAVARANRALRRRTTASGAGAATRCRLVVLETESRPALLSEPPRDVQNSMVSCGVDGRLERERGVAAIHSPQRVPRAPHGCWDGNSSSCGRR